MVDLRYVKKLIEMIDGSSVDSIEITTDKGVRIRIAKSGQSRGAAAAAQSPGAPPAIVPAMARTSPADGTPAVAEPVEAARPEPTKPPGHEVKSPMVGTFYGSPEPGTKPYVAVGDRVQKGQVLCIIEAMKIMNEIESEYSGIVRELLVQNAQPVEYGQVLFRIDPNG